MNHERHIPMLQFFPHEWLSRRGEKKIHHERRSREWWIFFLPQLLSHSWGKNCNIGMCLEWRMGNYPVPMSSLKRIFIPIQQVKTIKKNTMRIIYDFWYCGGLTNPQLWWIGQSTTVGAIISKTFCMSFYYCLPLWIEITVCQSTTVVDWISSGNETIVDWKLLK